MSLDDVGLSKVNGKNLFLGDQAQLHIKTLNQKSQSCSFYVNYNFRYLKLHSGTGKITIMDITVFIQMSTIAIFPRKIAVLHIQNDIFTCHNVFLGIQNYIMDIWNGFYFGYLKLRL